MSLFDLAECCEQLAAPDREMDEAIQAALVGAEIEWQEYAQKNAYHCGTRWVSIGEIKPYTASLDAAMTLVPEGWRIAEVGETVVACCNPWAVRLFQRCRHDRDSQKTRGDAATFALALCAAAMKARAASGMEARQGGNEVPCEARQPDGEAGTP